jgi:hypothetical protein
MPTRKPPPPPVTADQLAQAVVKAIVQEFDARALDIETARHGLALAAEQLVMAHMRATSQGWRHRAARRAR